MSYRVLLMHCLLQNHRYIGSLYQNNNSNIQFNRLLLPQGFHRNNSTLLKSAFSIEGAVAELGARSVAPALTASLKALLETCDLARFAPTGLDLTVMQRTYDEAQRIIVDLERTLR